MIARNRGWLSIVPALAFLFTTVDIARAQYDQPYYQPVPLPDANYTSTGVPGDSLSVQTAPEQVAPYDGYANNASADDLTVRVADLEKSLKKMQAAEAAAKKKAAEKPTVVIGGRIHLDAAGFNQDDQNKVDLGNYENGVIIRRAWLDAKGTAFEVLDYKWQFSFETDGKIKARDVYVGINELPILGHIRAGNFKEPFGLEQLESNNDTTFMERFSGDFFTPERHLGVMAFDCAENENATWAIGAFATSLDPKVQGDHLSTSMTMRGTWLPWYDEATEGRGLLHAGVAYSYRDAWENEYFGEIRPAECYLGNKYDAAVTNVDNINLVGTELAWVYGPLSVQSEYMMSFVNGSGIDGEATDEYNPKTFYVYTSYFLTGEHRPYRRQEGWFGRVKPFENFFRVRDANGTMQTGKGAWEVGYRWSWLDLNDGPIDKGEWSNHTIGLNWYLSPYMRLMWNYVHSTVDPSFNPGHPDSSVDVLEMRTQFDF